jgi:two-component system sensor histidine kinase KdpD
VYVPRLSRTTAWVLWIAVLVLVTVLLVAVRGRLDQAQNILIYLLVVLGGSASGGRALGLFLSAACFLLIDYYLQTPYDTLAVQKPLDWFVLLAFFTTATVAAQLLGHANAQAEAARRRAVEIDRLAALGAETLSAGRAETALEAILRVIGDALGGAHCAIYAVEEGRVQPIALAAVPDGAADDPPPGASAGVSPGVPSGVPSGVSRSGPPNPLVAWVAASGNPAAERADGSEVRGPAVLASAERDGPIGSARVLVLPLRVRDRTVGVLQLAAADEIALDAEQGRFLLAIAYYAALGVERLRLVAEAEHAQALREADRLKDALLASVSHDLRTPLTTIKALAGDIATGGDDRAAVIEQQADRLNHMVADLLDLSRLNAGGMPITAELNAAEDLVGAALQQVAGALDGRELRTEIEWTAPMAVGRFDFVHSLRILVNLIENALKYAPRTQPIEVAVQREGDQLAISVADRGPGVPASECQRIFEPFYRPAGASPDAGSAGLGLAIARRLATAQGGTLVYADRPGGGSIFTLRLPAAQIGEEAELAMA